MVNSFGARSTIRVDGREFDIYRLDALERHGIKAQRLPFSLRVLLENLLRHEDGRTVTVDDIKALAAWDPKAEPSREIAFTPSRVILQDFTGVPAVVDLAAMRDAMVKLGGDPGKINPLQPVDLVVDHSVQVDVSGTADSLDRNVDLEFKRNIERYAFLRWGQAAFRNFRLVPPATGIVHQVNLEYLARVVFTTADNPVAAQGGAQLAYPDSVIGTDSHTTMINGLGVLGWGVGGIEAEAAMLGQPLSMLIPQVVGFKLTGKLPLGATATDLVLTVTQMLRKKGVVGKFVEFFGPGALAIPLADRATIANMAPEYGATCGIFPVCANTLKYLELTGRPKALIQLVEAYYREQKMFGEEAYNEAEYSDVLELDLGAVEPSIAGPKRPQDRVVLRSSKAEWEKSLAAITAAAVAKKSLPQLAPTPAAGGVDTSALRSGSVVIAAITSCTNTSNPSVMMAAGILAKKAVARGLSTRPWVKTSLAPGSRVVPEYFQAAGVLEALDALRFNVVGFGCTTCIGNSGPLPAEISAAIAERDLVAVSVLSGNRNFEGRVHPEVRANYLASPPLVVAYALAGTMDIDFETEPVGHDPSGQPVFLREIWPTPDEVSEAIGSSLDRDMFLRVYGEVFAGDTRWRAIEAPTGDVFPWDDASTYVKHPPYFEGMTATPPGFFDVRSARVLAVLGDSITTDHISPAGSIKGSSPAGKYLLARGVAQEDFNQYGARRGNHEVMMRGTFANIRLRNKIAAGTEGGVTRHLPGGTEIISIFDASERYRADGVATIILAGKEYGSGSSRDWGAKGPALLGVRAVIAESFERIHRSNLVGMGVIPLQFSAGQTADLLGLTGEESFDIEGLAAALAGGLQSRDIAVKATRSDGTSFTFHALIRVDTPQELKYVEHGGILQYVLRQLAFGQS
jgi:aconitate hydratase